MSTSFSSSYSLQEITPEMQRAAKRSTWVSVVVNLCLSILQIVIGFSSRSQALVADGIHSLSDLIADFSVIIAGHFSTKAPDDDHPYGHRRYENAASLLLGVLLLAVALGMIFQAVEKFMQPESIAKVHINALAVAAIALVAKESLFRYMLAAAKRVRSSMLVANAWHARSDAASSLVVGIGIIGNLLGFPLFDPLAALVVGVMVGRMGVSFSWQAFQDLMDASASDETLAAIEAAIPQVAGVKGFHKLRTRKLGDMVAVDVDVEVDTHLSVVEGHGIAEAVAQRLRQIPDVLTVQVHIDPR